MLFMELLTSTRVGLVQPSLERYFEMLKFVSLVIVSSESSLFHDFPLCIFIHLKKGQARSRINFFLVILIMLMDCILERFHNINTPCFTVWTLQSLGLRRPFSSIFYNPPSLSFDHSYISPVLLWSPFLPTKKMT